MFILPSACVLWSVDVIVSSPVPAAAPAKKRGLGGIHSVPVASQQQQQQQPEEVVYEVAMPDEDEVVSQQHVRSVHTFSFLYRGRNNLAASYFWFISVWEFLICLEIIWLIILCKSWANRSMVLKHASWITLGKKATIHQLTTMLSISTNVLSPSHNHLLTTGADDPTL